MTRDWRERKSIAVKNVMPQGKAATIYDIASLAKVSPSTVSRALTQSKHPVSAEMRERILQAAKQLDYIPNAQARYLKTQNNPAIGIIIPSIDNPFYPSLVRGMADVAVEQGYSIYLSNCDREYQLTDRQVLSMLELNVHGIISIYLDKMTPSLRSFIERGGALVSLTGTHTEFEGVHNIQVDKVEESRIAMKHLVGLGHRKIALFMDELNCQIRADKVQGYRESLEQEGLTEYLYIYGLDCGQNDHSHFSTDADRAGTFVEAFLRRSPECTAILCMNDMLALGVCAALRKHGYRVPEDFSVMGYDNAFFSEFCYPALTTVALEKYAWGQHLMRYMLDLLDGSRKRSNSVQADFLEPVYLLERESTAKPRSWEISVTT